MKQYIYLSLLGILLTNFSLISFAQPANNPHKFSEDIWSYSERCNPCHVYKSAVDISAKEEFTISYESDSLSVADSSYLSGVSKICFTCHDGSVADFHHNADFEEGMGGSSVTKDHPVSVAYKFDSLKRKGLFNPEITMSGLGGTIAQDMLINGRVECTSCHDPHFSMLEVACKSCPSPRVNHMSSLLIENKRSALCLICHKL
jgi:hypothetical protein